jgi:hypothetical protein
MTFAFLSRALVGLAIGWFYIPSRNIDYVLQKLRLGQLLVHELTLTQCLHFRLSCCFALIWQEQHTL